MSNGLWAVWHPTRANLIKSYCLHVYYMNIHLYEWDDDTILFIDI